MRVTLSSTFTFGRAVAGLAVLEQALGQRLLAAALRRHRDRRGWGSQVDGLRRDGVGLAVGRFGGCRLFVLATSTQQTELSADETEHHAEDESHRDVHVAPRRN